MKRCLALLLVLALALVPLAACGKSDDAPARKPRPDKEVTDDIRPGEGEDAPAPDGAPAADDASAPQEPEPSAAPKYEDPLPVTAQVPEGTQLIQLGGVTMAIPADYKLLKERADYIQYAHPDYPSVVDVVEIDWQQTSNFYERGELMSYGYDYPDHIDEGEMRGEHYNVFWLKGAQHFVQEQVDYTAMIYLIYDYDRYGFYHVEFKTSGADPRLGPAEAGMAFDPNVAFVYPQEGSGS